MQLKLKFTELHPFFYFHTKVSALLRADFRVKVNFNPSTKSLPPFRHHCHLSNIFEKPIIYGVEYDLQHPNINFQLICYIKIMLQTLNKKENTPIRCTLPTLYLISANTISISLHQLYLYNRLQTIWLIICETSIFFVSL